MAISPGRRVVDAIQAIPESIVEHGKRGVEGAEIASRIYFFSSQDFLLKEILFMTVDLSKSCC